MCLNLHARLIPCYTKIKTSNNIKGNRIDDYLREAQDPSYHIRLNLDIFQGNICHFEHWMGRVSIFTDPSLTINYPTY